MEQSSLKISEEVGVTTVELVSPEQAQQLLTRNVHNRSLSKEWVDELARRIKQDRWAVTHQGIAIAIDGTVLDGQHRLAAIVQAKRTIAIRVTRGLPSEVRWNIDGQRVRKTGDQLNIYESMQGLNSGDTYGKGKDKQAIAAVLADNIAGCSAATLSDSMSTIKPFSDGVEFVLRSGFKKHLAVAPIRAGVAVAFKADPRSVSEFYAAFLTGAGLAIDSPALALRNVAQQGQRAAKSSWSVKRKLFLCTCRACEAHINHEPLKIVRPSVESFETFVGLYGLESNVRESAK